MIERLTLPFLLAGCILLGAIVIDELEPSAAPSEITIPARPATPPQTASAALLRRDQAVQYEALVATTLARPLFSATRRPPPRGSAEDSDDSGLADTRLAGIVIEPGYRIAIFAPEGAKPITVSEGQTVGRWRVENISSREVSLSGPDGIRTVRPKPDPNLVAAAAIPPAVERPATPGASPFSSYQPRSRPGVMPPIFNRAPPRPGQLRGQR
jgi:hypothetical protein